LLLLEIIAKHRDLSLSEWNFHKILEKHLLELLDKQRTYWKQRGTIKWVQLGDVRTKFFHANATLRNRRKLISHLTSTQGATAVNHTEKEQMLWQEYKERLGISEFTGFTINLGELQALIWAA